jgi:hypothetical protein
MQRNDKANNEIEKKNSKIQKTIEYIQINLIRILISLLLITRHWDKKINFQKKHLEKKIKVK